MQLFCFTFAGGTADFYNQLESLLPGVEFIKLEYAGHGERYKEKLYENFSELASDLYKIVSQKYSGGEYAFMGYSMGSISVAEMIKLIIAKKEMPLPCHVFLAAHEPFTKFELRNFKPDEMDEYVKERTVRFGGISEKILNNEKTLKTFWRLYLPLYRADYSVIARYDFNSLDLNVQIPATVFYSPTDTKEKDMYQWHKYFTGEFEMLAYSGSHFFINEHRKEMADVIRRKLEMYGGVM